MLIYQSPATRRLIEEKVRQETEDAQVYKILQWRKRLERKGWKNANRFPPPTNCWIEYHAVWQGRIWSGRCHLGQCDPHDWDRPGTHIYLIKRRHDVPEAVWRRTATVCAEMR